MEKWLRKLEDVDCELLAVADAFAAIDDAFRESGIALRKNALVSTSNALLDLSERVTQIINDIYEEKNKARTVINLDGGDAA